MKARFAVLALLLALLGAACTPRPASEPGRILLLGDSVMAWNGAQSVGPALESALGRPVDSRARSGARFAAESGLARATGFDIRAQYVPGAWDWVVLNGGANDLRARCGCAACDRELDALISPDGSTGAWPAFLARLRGEGRRVMVMGYYGPSGRGGGFDICSDELTELDRRLSALAARSSGLFFTDGGDVMGRSTPGLYDTDNVHPTPQGSAVLAAHLARAIRRAE